MEQLISVIIPTFNREATITKSINSVLNQTYDNIEVVVVDDYSTDNTENIVKKIIDPRLRYIKLEKNSGACVARNCGVKLARAEIIAFQDSDDIWHKDKLKRQLDYINDNNLDFCSSAFVRISPKDRRIIAGERIIKEKESLWCDLLNHNWVSTQTIICKKKCFEQIKFDENIKRYQDWDIALQAVNYFKVGHFTVPLVDVYLQSDSITNTVKNDEAMMSVVMKHENDIRNRKMRAQFHKTLADIQRKKDRILAAKNYRKSFFLQPTFKKFLCYLMCVTGGIKFYKNRQ